MSQPDPFDRLRDLPLPELDPELSASIRRRARAALAGPTAQPRDQTRRWVELLVAAAVFTVCALHAGWTWSFVGRLYP